jgi:hypothetical protein
MEFKNEENILEQSLRGFEKKHRLLSLWISLKVRIKLYWLNLISDKQ